ncbi:nuclear RNA export factor 2 isoform X2 [Prionailurus iriomotensis]
MGHNNTGNSLQRRARCSGIYRRRHNNWSGHVRSGIDSSSHQQQDGDPATNDSRMSTRGRYIPFGIRYDEKWLLNLIQKQCSAPFTPVEFHYEKMQAQFFVENAGIAFALKSVNGKIWNENNEMISIFVHPSDAPQSVQKELKPENVDQIKRVRFAPGILVIPSPRLLGDMVTRDIEMVPNPRNSMAASRQTHEKNMFKLLPSNLSDKKPYQMDGLSNTMQNASSIKALNLSNSESAGELDKGKRLQREDMSANRSPLCTTFPDKSTNISSILELFSKLLCLDGQESPSPTSVGIAAHKRLPTCKGSFFGSDALKSLVLQFLQQYYLIYDSGDHQGLLGAYHDEACFSRTIPFNPKEPAPSSLCEYLKESRNMKKVQDPCAYLRVQLLKHTKHDIVHSLCVLPKTQHDLSSFVVDIWFQMDLMLCFSVNGVFKEVEGMSQDSVRAFTRTFIANPVNNYSIVHDDLSDFMTAPGTTLVLALPKAKHMIPEEVLIQTDPGS